MLQKTKNFEQMNNERATREPLKNLEEMYVTENQ